MVEAAGVEVEAVVLVEGAAPVEEVAGELALPTDAADRDDCLEADLELRDSSRLVLRLAS